MKTANHEWETLPVKVEAEIEGILLLKECAWGANYMLCRDCGGMYRYYQGKETEIVPSSYEYALAKQMAREYRSKV